MKYTYTIVAIIILICITACQTTEKVTTKKFVSYGPHFDVEWHKEIRKYERDHKKDSFELVTYENIVNNWNRDIMISELGITEWMIFSIDAWMSDY
jgi:hypothetical protein